MLAIVSVLLLLNLIGFAILIGLLEWLLIIGHVVVGGAEAPQEASEGAAKLWQCRYKLLAKPLQTVTNRCSLVNKLLLPDDKLLAC